MAFAASGAGFSFAVTSDGLDQTSASEREAQQKALSNLLSVLLSAGYFRARIIQLAPFDKVVGGLCWAISSSGAAVDVDLFYDNREENNLTTFSIVNDTMEETILEQDGDGIIITE